MINLSAMKSAKALWSAFVLSALLFTIGFSGIAPTLEFATFTAQATYGQCENPITLDFSGFSAGEHMTNQYSAQGVTISASNNVGSHPDKAIIFDSSNPTGGDPDLGTPNQIYGGPGVGNGGTATNDTPLGNLLILAEDDVDTNPSDGLVDDPDDEASGGKLFFDFDNPVKIISADVLDIEEGGTKLRGKNSGGTTIFDLSAANLGNNSVQTISVNQGSFSTSKLELKLKSSGAIDNIVFCPEPEPFCGDGNLDDGEECDDGNNDDDDGCSATCEEEPECGDGNLDDGEECDDGNNTNGDGCSDTCELEPFCGDGNLDDGEECDDGNNDNGDGCSANCTTETPDPFCGDGNLDQGEECDDGNNDNGDGCDANCNIESQPECGDGNLDDGEECDDGNNTNGDGCDAQCNFEDEICEEAYLQLNVTYFNNYDPPNATKFTDMTDDIFVGTGNSPFGTQSVQIPLTTNTGADAIVDNSPGNTYDDVEGLHIERGEDNDGPYVEISAYGFNHSKSRESIKVDVEFISATVTQINNGNGGPHENPGGQGCGITEGNPQIDQPGNDEYNFTVGQSTGDICSTTNTHRDRVKLHYAYFEDPECEEDPVCGNGILEQGEECDDGNTENGDGCSEFCTEEITECKLVKFVSPFNEIDDTTGWSTNNSTVELGVNSFTILNGTATVTGFDDGSEHELTHRGTRGLGVQGGENDEIDSTDKQEKIVIEFDAPVLIDEFQVRSLFANEGHGNEEGDVDIYLNNTLVNNFHMIGQQSGGSGVFSQTVPLVKTDKIEFYVEPGQSYTEGSEFAVAKLSVCPTDEPFCGDGNVDEGEECDDGNDNNDDGCDNECNIVEPECGNGIVEDGEECDDGNNIDDDGCSNSCEINEIECDNLVKLSFTDFETGQNINDEYSEFGIAVSADNNNSNHPDKAIIFDSSNPTPEDTDLGTPNEAFGGPGIGAGGTTTNDTALGNVLIVAENDDDDDEDGFVDVPDDESAGGELIFDFDNDVRIISLEIIDIEEDNVVVKGFDSSNSEIFTQAVPNLGNNSVQKIIINQTNFETSQFVVDLVSSGAIDNIEVCIPEIEPFCGDGIVDEGEECDDGNDNNDDGCTNECKIEFLGCADEDFVMYGVHDFNELSSVFFRFRPATGEITALDAVINIDLEALDSHPVTEEIYGITGDYPEPPEKKKLVLIDRQTGIPPLSTGVPLDIGVDQEYTAMSFHPTTNELWASGKNVDLRTIDLTTGVSTVKFPLFGRRPEGMAWDTDGENLYINYGTKVKRYNPEADALFPVCEFPEGTKKREGLEFDNGNLVVGWHKNSNQPPDSLGGGLNVDILNTDTCLFEKSTMYNTPNTYNDVEGMTFLCEESTIECGNGVVEFGEECDDGNDQNGDGCTVECTIEAQCGNEIIEGNEECDDGNLEDGDGCSSQCQEEGIACENLQNVTFLGVNDEGNFNSTLFRYQPQTASLFAFDTKNGVDVEAMDASPVTGTMYGFTGDKSSPNGDKRLIIIDTVTDGIPDASTGVPLDIGSGQEYRAASFHPVTGELWATGDKIDLVTVDLNTGASSVEKPLGDRRPNAIAWNPDGSKLVVYYQDGAGVGKFKTFDPDTYILETACVMDPAFPIVKGMEYDYEGRLVISYDEFGINVQVFDLDTCATAQDFTYNGVVDPYDEIETVSFECATLQVQ